MPGYYPKMMIGGLAGGYGGWKIVDAILNARRTREGEDEVDQARGAFQHALLGQYDHPVAQGSKLQKAAADEMTKLGQDLDALYDALEKRGTLEDWWNKSLGAYGVYALGTGGLAAYAAYKANEGSTKRDAIDKALKYRAARRQAMQPAEFYATPMPVGRNRPLVTGVGAEDAGDAE